MGKRLLIASTVALAVLSGCTHFTHEHHQAGTFLVTSPLRMDTLLTKDYVCQIRGIQHIEMRALEEGYLQEIFVDEGQYVKAGQPMFQIMPMLYQAELKKAEAEAEFARIEYQNTKSLADSNIVSANELALARARMSKAEAELSLAQVHLGFTQIKAPFSGIMDRFQVRLGSLLEEGELLTSLSDISQLWVYFNVPEAEYLDYQTNLTRDSLMPVRLRMANDKLFEYTGVVETIEADFNNETGNIAFRATFPNPKKLLRHGETGNILMDVPLKNVLLIPQKATFEILDKHYVYVVGQDSVIRSKQVAIGEEMPHLYVVTDGLEETDKILLEGLRKARNGQAIHYRFQEPAEVINHLSLYAE